MLAALFISSWVKSALLSQANNTYAVSSTSTASGSDQGPASDDGGGLWLQCKDFPMEENT